MRFPKAAVFALALIMVLTPVGAAAAAGRLIEADPSVVALDAPGPGQSRAWEMSVRSVTDQTVPLTLSVTGESAQLFDGPAPLQLDLKDPRNGTVVFSGPVAEVLGSRITLPNLEGRGDYALAGSVALPASADNRYQNAGGTLIFTFRAETPAASPSQLAITGSHFATGLLLLIGVPLVLFGAIILIARRKRKK